ncbi:hypothetical protein PoB_000415700 [Plakobranchus ocellatus]|uniref:Uncharacterized protein n=1 Tax=Plakobranchus ocellatus TaxID=259542 RepID=A0AAV3Y5D6_9GAST|nr:hypothetical protein PoB_000415700 [Plakobranchus ocellatus]
MVGTTWEELDYQLHRLCGNDGDVGSEGHAFTACLTVACATRHWLQMETASHLMNSRAPTALPQAPYAKCQPGNSFNNIPKHLFEGRRGGNCHNICCGSTALTELTKVCGCDVGNITIAHGVRRDFLESSVPRKSRQLRQNGGGWRWQGLFLFLNIFQLKGDPAI